MKFRITYKELSLFAGILVAIILLILYWVNTASLSAANLSFEVSFHKLTDYSPIKPFLEILSKLLPF